MFFLHAKFFLRCLKMFCKRGGGDDDQKKIVRIICSWNSCLIEIKISFWSRGLYNQLVSRRGSGDFRVIWHNLQPLMGTFTFLEGKGKTKTSQHPTDKQSTSPVSSFRFSYNKTQHQFFIFQKTLAKDWDVKMGFWGWGKRYTNKQTNKQSR